MPTALTSGYSNNLNIIQVRTNGTTMQRLTDRAIDMDNDGSVEVVTLTHVSGHAVGTPSAPGGKMRVTVTEPDGIARSVIKRSNETDGGLTTNSTVDEFTEGGS